MAGILVIEWPEESSAATEAEVSWLGSGHVLGCHGGAGHFLVSEKLQ